ncbi:MAG: LysR family transcriptional regulator [Vallitaleaceae bacterium]|jgi:DNA-binding transcriptional LysR family regulator|nr:LysR family transcriptional regulator [Vallitaleaceae bacterium]
MNLEYYRTFYQVAKDGNITKAAKSLFISQPAVSKTIKTLEEQLGCNLFVRTPSGVVLTTEGSALYKQVEIALQHINAGENIIKKHIDLAEGSVKIGISNTLCKYIFIPMLDTFHKLYPDIQIEVINRSSISTHQMVKSGALDFGITTIKSEDESLNYSPFMKIQDIVVTGQKDLPLIGDKINLQALNNYPLMMLEKSNTSRHYIDEFLKAHTLSLNADIEISNMEFLIEFAKIGIGQAFVIKNFVEKELASGELIKLDTFPVIPPREIAIISLSDVPTSIASKYFIKHILTTYHLD